MRSLAWQNQQNWTIVGYYMPVSIYRFYTKLPKHLMFPTQTNPWIRQWDVIVGSTNLGYDVISAWSRNHSTASFCICFVQTRLLQCSSSWITGCYSSTSSTCAECFSSVDPGLETTRSRHSSVERTALAPDQTEDRIQTLSSRLLVDQRPSSVLSSRQVDICVGSSWSRIVAFRTD